MWLYEGLNKDPNLNDNAVPLIQKFPTRCQQAVMGLDMYNILKSSVLTVNRHTDASNGRVGNMRMFEATGLGTCLVTDDGKNIFWGGGVEFDLDKNIAWRAGYEHFKFDGDVDVDFISGSLIYKF